jgi:predicted ATPase
MLTSLKAERFKSWQDTGEIRFAPLTTFFGTNSSGKTSLLQLLLMFKQTVESTDRSQILHFGDRRSLVELGTYTDVIHRHEPDGELKWEMGWTLPSRLDVQDPAQPGQLLFSGDQMGFAAQLAWLGNGDGLGRAAVQRMACVP